MATAVAIATWGPIYDPRGRRVGWRRSDRLGVPDLRARAAAVARWPPGRWRGNVAASAV